MNDKRAKTLRSLAKQVAEKQKLPEQLLVMHKETKVIINHPKSERGVYRRLKKHARNTYGSYPRRTEVTPSS